MTTLLRTAGAKELRCDRCRQLWAVAADHVGRRGWYEDELLDVHLCPRCHAQRELSEGERRIVAARRAGGKRLMALFA